MAFNKAAAKADTYHYVRRGAQTTAIKGVHTLHDDVLGERDIRWTIRDSDLSGNTTVMDVIALPVSARRANLRHLIAVQLKRAHAIWVAEPVKEHGFPQDDTADLGTDITDLDE